MTPETAALVRKSHNFLLKAADMMTADWPDEAGRAAYLAGFSAAQALLWERQRKVFKTHHGVQAEFARFIQSAPDLEDDLRKFLGRGFGLKTRADYWSEPDVPVTNDEARTAIATATRLVAWIEAALLGSP